MQPVRHEFLFQPKLTLYLPHLDLGPAFRSPRYAVTLGRSQDLFSYVRVAEIVLEEAPRAYLEGTLLPGSMSQITTAGIAIGPAGGRAVGCAGAPRLCAGASLGPADRGGDHRRPARPGAHRTGGVAGHGGGGDDAGADSSTCPLHRLRVPTLLQRPTVRCLTTSVPASVNISSRGFAFNQDKHGRE